MNGTTNFMINKSKSFTSGERRSFVIRIRMNQSEFINKNDQDGINNKTCLNKKSGLFSIIFLNIKIHAI